MDKGTPEYSAAFATWTSELYGADAVNMMPAHQAYRRVVLAIDRHGKPTYKDPIYVPVDKYGLPVPVLGSEPTVEEQLQLRWDAALIDHPLFEQPSRRPMPAPTKVKYQSAELLLGKIRQDAIREQGVLAWKSAGFTPELYVLLHELIPQAVERLEVIANQRACSTWLSERLDSLGIYWNEDFSVFRLQLDAQPWSDLPRMMVKVRPSEAVQLVIGLGMPIALTETQS